MSASVPKLLPEQIAEVCHEANAAYCRGLGDDSQPMWAEAPDWQRNSAINGVKFHQSRGGKPDGPRASHENWMREKLADGWKYGAVKNPTKKEHPCLVPYDELPKDQQVKDALFTAIVRVLSHNEAANC